MGYYSDYYIDFDEDCNKNKEQNPLYSEDFVDLDKNIQLKLKEEFKNLGFSDFYERKDNILFPNKKCMFWIGNSKWYEFEEDMKNLSLKLPNILLCLQIFGEESGDIRCFYFKNGESEEVNVSIVVAERKKL